MMTVQTLIHLAELKARQIGDAEIEQGRFNNPSDEAKHAIAFLTDFANRLRKTVALTETDVIYCLLESLYHTSS